MNTKKGKRTCWNCGEEGHLRRNCLKPKKEQGASDSKSSSTAHVSVASDSVSDQAFGIEEPSDSDSMPEPSPTLMLGRAMMMMMTRIVVMVLICFSDMGDDVDEIADGDEVDWSDVSSFVERASVTPSAEHWDSL